MWGRGPAQRKNKKKLCSSTIQNTAGSAQSPPPPEKIILKEVIPFTAHRNSQKVDLIVLNIQESGRQTFFSQIQSKQYQGTGTYSLRKPNLLNKH
jgi:hypothetical protein